MKKLFLLAIVFSVSLVSSAQFTVNQSPYFDINVIHPNYDIMSRDKLTMQGGWFGPNADYTRAVFSSNIHWDANNHLWKNTSTSTYRDFGMIRFENGSEIGFYVSSYQAPTSTPVEMTNADMEQNRVMILTKEKRVGIGTSNPQKKLHIYNTSTYEAGLIESPNHGTNFRYKDYTGNAIEMGIQEGDAVIRTNSRIRLLVESGSGNVGIGTSNPDSKLTVKGKIHCEEVKVDLSVPADYVFEKYYTGDSELNKDYVMPTLEEVEAYTKENHHLPEIPSAQEIKNNGLKLKEMTNLLLQKIEELTLYTIEQEKRIKALEAKLTAIEKAKNK